MFNYMRLVLNLYLTFNTLFILPEGLSPLDEDNNVVVEPISLDKRHSIECYVMDVVDPLNSVHSTGYRSLYSSPKPCQG